MIPLSDTHRHRLVTFMKDHCVRTTGWDRPFTFASGEQGIVKFDLDPLWRDAAMRGIVGKAMTTWMMEHAPETTLLGGPASAGPKVARAMLPYVRPDGAVRMFSVPKVPGQRVLDDRLVMRGKVKPNDMALIVDDVGRKGTSILASWRILQKHHAPVLHALVVLDRPEGIAPALAKMGIAYDFMVAREEMGVEDLLTTPAPTP